MTGVDPPQIKIGRLGKPNGLDGYLGIYIEPENLSYIEPDSIVYVLDREYAVRAVRRGKKGPQVAFAEITTREAAEAIRGNDVYAAERRQLDEGEFWPEDLIGLDVRPNGGSVVAIEHGPTQARLVIERAESRFEVPFVDELVPVVDLDGGFVEVAEIEGLSEPTD